MSGLAAANYWNLGPEQLPNTSAGSTEVCRPLRDSFLEAVAVLIEQFLKTCRNAISESGAQWLIRFLGCHKNLAQKSLAAANMNCRYRLHRARCLMSSVVVRVRV